MLRKALRSQKNQSVSAPNKIKLGDNQKNILMNILLILTWNRPSYAWKETKKDKGKERHIPLRKWNCSVWQGKIAMNKIKREMRQWGNTLLRVMAQLSLLIGADKKRASDWAWFQVLVLSLSAYFLICKYSNCSCLLERLCGWTEITYVCFRYFPKYTHRVLIHKT